MHLCSESVQPIHPVTLSVNMDIHTMQPSVSRAMVVVERNRNVYKLTVRSAEPIHTIPLSVNKAMYLLMNETAMSINLL